MGQVSLEAVRRKPLGRCLHLVKVGVPDSYFRRQVLEDAVATGFYREVTAFALCAFIAFARLKPLH